jgi:hypothetical protein
VAFLRIILASLTTLIALVVLLPVALLVLPFWVVSLLTRTIARALEPKFLTRAGLIQFDRTFGWRAYPNLNTHHLMVDLFHIRTDGDGWRGKHTLTESDVVVFGDSFAAGYGVSDRHFFANLSGPQRIKPIGIGGYSMVQELLWMQQLKESLRGKLLVWFVYYGNDLYDNLMPDLRGYRKPFVRETREGGGWEIVSSHVTPDRWPLVTEGRIEGQNHLPRLGEICSETFLSGRVFNACEYLFQVGNDLCQQVDAQLVVMSIPDACQLTGPGRQMLKTFAGDPDSFDAGRPDKKIGAICNSLGIQFVSGETFLDISCYKTNDCHWNEKGHREVAKMLWRLKASRPQSAYASGTLPAPSGRLSPVESSAV